MYAGKKFRLWTGTRLCIGFDDLLLLIAFPFSWVFSGLLDVGCSANAKRGEVLQNVFCMLSQSS